jgi:hypothetical protein
LIIFTFNDSELICLEYVIGSRGPDLWMSRARILRGASLGSDMIPRPLQSYSAVKGPTGITMTVTIIETFAFRICLSLFMRHRQSYCIIHWSLKEVKWKILRCSRTTKPIMLVRGERALSNEPHRNACEECQKMPHCIHYLKPVTSPLGVMLDFPRTFSRFCEFIIRHSLGRGINIRGDRLNRVFSLVSIILRLLLFKTAS